MIATGKTAPATLSIRTFGEVVVTVGADDHPIHFEARTVEALLIYLACQRRPCGRDQLAELLWPDRTQQQGRAITILISSLPAPPMRTCAGQR